MNFFIPEFNMFTKIKINFNFLKQWKLSFNNFVNRNGDKLAVSRKKAKVLERLSMP